MYAETKQLHEDRAALMKEFREIAQEETDLKKGETLSQDRQDESNKIYKDVEVLDEKIERQERALKFSDDDKQRLEQKADENDNSFDEEEANEKREIEVKEKADKMYSRAMIRYITAPKGSTPDPKDIAILESRAQSSTDSEGGYTIDEKMFNVVDKALLFFGGMRQAARVIRTTTGGPLQMPNYNDTGNTGALIAENTQDSEQDITFGNLTLNGWSYTSKIIRIPRQLLQDSEFNIIQIVGEALGERLARIGNTHQTTGSGSSRPRGVVVASAEGKETSSASVIAADEFFDLEHSVDPSYRDNPSSLWMFKDSTLKVIRKLKGTDSQYLWQPGLVAGQPNMFLGHRYIINQDMAAIGANAKSVLFGDFSKYFIRDVLPITLRRSDDRYFEYNQVAFVAWMRMDADLQNAGTNPIKHMVQPAS